MKLRDIKLSTRMTAGFMTILLLVGIISYISYVQSRSLWIQTEEMYTHPMQVTSAIGELKYNIILINREMKSYVLSESEIKEEQLLRNIAEYEAEIENDFKILYENYLGDKSDIDFCFDAFKEWSAIRTQTIQIKNEERTDEALVRTELNGIDGMQTLKIIKGLEKMRSFAKNKSKEFYKNAKNQKETLNTRLSILLTVIIVITSLIGILLIRSFNKPISVLISGTEKYKNGEYSARCGYNYKNEFGELSSAFNKMADSVEQKIRIESDVSKISSELIIHNNFKPFAENMLKLLLNYTGSQVAALYMLNKAGQKFEHYSSIGLSNQNKKTFESVSLEGEFGPALANKTIMLLKDIPSDTTFFLSGVTGNYIPKEIITIPIAEQDTVVAVVSLASVNKYSEYSIKLVNSLWVNLSAQLVSVMSFETIRQYSQELNNKNSELETLTRELSQHSEELKEYNIELEIQKKELDNANRLKSSFLANMSHELRTPLNSIIALSGILEKKLTGIPEEQQDYIRIIERNGKHLLSLINDILDLSRIEAGKEELVISEISVYGLIVNVISGIEPIALTKGISVINKINNDGLKIESDESKCYHIFQNIIANAVKFTEFGSVEISASVSDEKLIVKIKDTGIGIANEHLNHIFDEFRQADEKVSRKHGGTGLGLTISQKYAKMMGGLIEVDSEPDKGSVFSIILPLKNKYFKSGQTDFLISTKGKSTYHGQFNDNSFIGKTILIVEDSEPAIIQIKEILDEININAKIAKNGEEALNFVKAYVPDAIILDLMMPDIDGFMVLKQIREYEKTKHLPVLILTAKHITKEELSFLESNSIYQLIFKGDVNKNDLVNNIAGMLVKPDNHIKDIIPRKSVTAGKGKKTKILVIEDNSDNIITIKAILEDKYILSFATDGETGLEKAKSDKPDMILLDISLPKMDGFKVLSNILSDANTKHIPVIALTSRAMKGDREELLNFGFDAYVSKPIDITYLLNTIESFIKTL